MDGKLSDPSWTLLGGRFEKLAIWFHWSTPESIPMWSPRIHWVWFSVVVSHGETRRCHLKTIQAGSFWVFATPSEARKFKKSGKRDIPKIPHHIDKLITSVVGAHGIPAVKLSQTSTAICCWKANSLFAKPVLRLSNMLKMTESFASWGSCRVSEPRVPPATVWQPSWKRCHLRLWCDSCPQETSNPTWGARTFIHTGSHTYTICNWIHICRKFWIQIYYIYIYKKIFT